MTSGASNGAIVRLEQLGKIYHPSPLWMRMLVRSNITRPVVALEDLSFEVGPGEICALVGPNGAGKTTTFRILVGLTTPTSGRATVLGLDTTRQSIQVRRLVGFMPAEERSLLMRLTCTENLRFHGRLQGLKGKELQRRIGHTLESVGLGHAADRSVFALSAGMRARLQLARALLHEPQVLVLDEPTGSVDPVAAHELLNLIISVVGERGIAALISSHRLEEIEALHAHVVLLDEGRARYDGDLDTLRAQWERPRLELTFHGSDGAERASELVKASELADLLRLEGPIVELALAPWVTTGDVLVGISPLLDDLAHLRELRMPLRDLLADVYLGGSRP